jgi:hypothetical protein
MINVEVKKLGLKKKTLNLLTASQMNTVRGGVDKSSATILQPTVSMKGGCTDNS